MVFIHGKGTAVLVDAVDLTSYFSDSTTERGVDTAEVTTYGNDDKVYLAGQEMGEWALAGFGDFDAAAVDETLAALFTDNTPIVTIGMNGIDAVGDVATLVQGTQTSYTVSSPVDNAVAVAASGEASGGLRNGGVVLHALGARTATFDGTSHDSSASSAFGGVGHLHVTAFTGTDVDIKIQDSPDDAVWADLISWNITATGASRTVATGTVDRYLRVAITGGTFTTVTFAAAFARNRR